MPSQNLPWYLLFTELILPIESHFHQTFQMCVTATAVSPAPVCVFVQLFPMQNRLCHSSPLIGQRRGVPLPHLTHLPHRLSLSARDWCGPRDVSEEPRLQEVQPNC